MTATGLWSDLSATSFEFYLRCGNFSKSVLGISILRVMYRWNCQEW